MSGREAPSLPQAPKTRLDGPYSHCARRASAAINARNPPPPPQRITQHVAEQLGSCQRVILTCLCDCSVGTPNSEGDASAMGVQQSPPSSKGSSAPGRQLTPAVATHRRGVDGSSLQRDALTAGVPHPAHFPTTSGKPSNPIMLPSASKSNSFGSTPYSSEYGVTSLHAQIGEPKRTRVALQGACGVQAQLAGVRRATDVDRVLQMEFGDADGCTASPAGLPNQTAESRGVGGRPEARQVAPPEGW